MQANGNACIDNAKIKLWSVDPSTLNQRCKNNIWANGLWLMAINFSWSAADLLFAKPRSGKGRGETRAFNCWEAGGGGGGEYSYIRVLPD